MFKRVSEKSDQRVTVFIEGVECEVPAGETVAAAVIVSGIGHTRTTAISDSQRAPFCLMGVCYECLMIIDGKPNRRACKETVNDGMTIERQSGTGEL